mgnify:CR=1 FL=1
MNLLSLLVISFVPGLLWLWFFYRKDKYNPEPVGLVLKSFVYGIFAIFPAILFEYPFSKLIAQPPNLLTLLLLTILVIGLVEEVMKYIVIRYTVYKSPEFDEVMDGIIYLVSAALGFAAFENLLYSAVLGFKVGLIRALVTSIVHASFSGILGYYVGRAKLESKPNLIYFGLAQVVVLHGLYDFVVMGGLISTAAVLLIVVLLYFYLLHLIKDALRRERIN